MTYRIEAAPVTAAATIQARVLPAIEVVVAPALGQIGKLLSSTGSAVSAGDPTIEWRLASNESSAADVHGRTVPRGWSRTWPNLMTMEAVLGGEQYIFNPGFAPLAAHELALSVVFESGLQHFVETPESLSEQPGAVQRVLRDVPTAWDERKYLAGRPDEHVMIARRNGDDWWVGAVNGVDEEVALMFDPADLDVEGRPAEIICDGVDKRSYDVREVTLADPIGLDLLDQVGCLIRID